MIINDYIKTELENVAKEFDLPKLILFGSRATDSCWERSDIDIAAEFDSTKQYLSFCERVEEIQTLLIFDVVNLNSDMIDLNVRKSIKDEGVVLYEKV